MYDEIREFFRIEEEKLLGETCLIGSIPRYGRKFGIMSSSVLDNDTTNSYSILHRTRFQLGLRTALAFYKRDELHWIDTLISSFWAVNVVAPRWKKVTDAYDGMKTYPRTLKGYCISETGKVETVPTRVIYLRGECDRNHSTINSTQMNTIEIFSSLLKPCESWIPDSQQEYLVGELPPAIYRRVV